MHQQTALNTALLSLESFLTPGGDLLQQDLDRLVRTVPSFVNPNGWVPGDFYDRKWRFDGRARYKL